MFARFDEKPAMTLRVIKETKRYGRTDGRTDNVKTVYPLQTKFARGIIIQMLKYLFFSVPCNTKFVKKRKNSTFSYCKTQKLVFCVSMK